MSRGVKIILMIIGGVIIIAAIIFYFVWDSRNQPSNITNQINVGGELPDSRHLIINDNVQVVPSKDNATTLTVDQQTEIGLERKSFDIAERFGSYSSQNKFSNIYDLEPLMTAKMKDWSENFISQHLKDNVGVYFGVTTRALAVKSKDIKDDQAQITVSTLREETSAGSTKSYNEDIKLDFKKVDNEWLLDQVTWQ